MDESSSDFGFDLLDEREYLLLEVTVPGVIESDIDITFEGARMIIRAERPAASGLFLHSEIKRGLLLRDITLPCAVELLKSWYEDGVLRLQLKRLEAM